MAIPLLTLPVFSISATLNGLIQSINSAVDSLTAAIASATTGSIGATTAISGAATLNTRAGVVTSEALVAATTYTLTLANSLVTANSVVLCTPFDSVGTGVQVTSITPGSQSVVIVVAMAARTGTVTIPFTVTN
jgi:hypothetical protein